MADVSVQHVDREIITGIARAVLGHKGEVPCPVEVRTRKGLARNCHQGYGKNETGEERKAAR